METKVCSKCGIEKPLNQFYKTGFNSKGQQLYRSDCKECQRKYDLSRLKLRNDFVNSQKKCCAKCGETRTYVLEFHHKDPNEKEFTIGQMKNYPLDKFQKEIDKCVVLCANCHKEFHTFEREGVTLEEYLET